MVRKTKEFPFNSEAKKYLPNTHYLDCFEGILPENTEYNHEEFVACFFYKWPAWIRFLFTLRGALAKILNLEHDNSQIVSSSELPELELSEGSMLSIFSVCMKTENELIFRVDDEHLSAVLSFYLEHSNTNKLIVSTQVEFNNFKGRFYFWLIKPFHKLIVKSQLKTGLRYFKTKLTHYETV
ncbi:MAG: DUF2867 domain-containing protein [Bacteroidales bacterium]|nr:DUF2867 domain-containing protein [Bacteroidales bacterium]MBN2817393.1 DUF2867 domain-containing protein [Bacteroidales bacterium]